MLNYKNSKNKKAFTLSEALITIIIVGVVTAIIIPNLQKNSQEVEFKSAFLKQYSSAQNAFRKAAQENGGSLVGYSNLTGDSVNRCNELKDFVKSNLSYIKDCPRDQIAKCSPTGVTYKTYSNNNFPSDWPAPNVAITTAALILKDGSTWWFMAFYSDMGNCANSRITNTKNACGHLAIDTNGGKKPNQAGKDLFEFYVASDGSIIPLGTQNDGYKNSYSKTIGYNPASEYMLGIIK